MDFSRALDELKAGNAVSRSGWNGMWIAYSPGTPALPAASFWSYAGKKYATRRGGVVKVLPILIKRNMRGEIVMGWLASQEDILADDWGVVEPN